MPTRSTHEIIINIFVFNTNSLFPFFLYIRLLVNSFLFGYDYNELVLCHFLSNKLGFKSTSYFSCKSIEVSWETDGRTEFAISVASLRFPIPMNSRNKLSFAIRRFVISSGLTF